MSIAYRCNPILFWCDSLYYVVMTSWIHAYVGFCFRLLDSDASPWTLCLKLYGFEYLHTLKLKKNIFYVYARCGFLVFLAIMSLLKPFANSRKIQCHQDIFEQQINNMKSLGNCTVHNPWIVWLIFYWWGVLDLALT